MTTLFDQIVAAVIPMLEVGPKRSAIAQRAAYAAIHAASQADDASVETVIDPNLNTADDFRAMMSRLLL
jgi:hypothetical protein